MSGLAQMFDLSNGVVILRLICGLFFIPHIVGKFTEPATLNFFKAAKFEPPATWMYIAGTIETFLTIGLVFAIYTPYVAVRCRHPSPGGRRGDLESHEEMDLGDRRLRILPVLGARLLRARLVDVAEIGSAEIESRATYRSVIYSREK